MPITPPTAGPINTAFVKSALHKRHLCGCQCATGQCLYISQNRIQITNSSNFAEQHNEDLWKWKLLWTHTNSIEHNLWGEIFCVSCLFCEISQICDLCSVRCTKPDTCHGADVPCSNERDAVADAVTYRTQSPRDVTCSVPLPSSSLHTQLFCIHLFVFYCTFY